VGLVSRTFIVPISPEQDTAGPMTRTVADAAAVLTAIAGSDPADPATREADAHRTDYLKALSPTALRGARIGVIRKGSPQTDPAFNQALDALKAAGAILVDVKLPDRATLEPLGTAEFDALVAEFKPALDAYLASTPPAVKTRSLDQLIAFDAATPAETPLFGQDIFELAAKAPPLTDPGYRAKRDTARRLATEVLEGFLRDNQVEALVAATTGPAWVVDPVNGDSFAFSASELPAVAGWPHLTVPMGGVQGLPVGLSFIGPKWSEARLLALGYAYEQASHARLTPAFLPSLAARPEVARAYDPR
jgi:amidase